MYKDFKFVRHDLKLYLTDLAHRDEEYQRKFMRLAADYCATISDETLAMVYPLERICVHLIRRLDVAETLRAVDYLRYGFKLSTDLVERDGKVYWTAKYLDTPEDRAVMDVTEMGFHRLPFSRINLYNQVTSARVVGSRLHLEGAVVNQLGRLDPPGRPVAVGVAAQPGPRRPGVPTGWTTGRSTGDRLHYRTVVDLSRAVGALDAAGAGLGPAAGDQQGRRDERHAVQHRPGDGVRVSPSGSAAGSAALAPGYVEPFVTPKLNLAFQQARRHGRDPGGRAGEPVRDPGPACRCAGGRARRWATTPR